jgi:hypothetical protein
MNKLKSLPSVYYVTLEDSKERQDILKEQFFHYGITPNAITSKRYNESNDIITGKYVYQLTDQTKGNATSHLKALLHWYENTDEEYGFFCEDDLSLETVKYWNFTWEEFILSLPSDWQAVQLTVIRDKFDCVRFRERLWDDWAVTAYILKRDYVRSVINNYCRENSYHLELKNCDVMPICENLLLSNISKVYSIPLFIENTNISSTNLQDIELKNGQKPNHYYSADYVLNWWEKNGKIYSLNMIMDNKYPELIDYCLDSEDAEKNFNLALWYENQGQTASAISFFIRSAERTDDILMSYECLIRASLCFDRQGNRNSTVRGLLQHAISICPERPEAYYLLSRFDERHQMYADCYTMCNIALSTCNFNCSPLLTDVEYPGKYGLIFEKAVSSYWWGKGEESRQLFQILKNEYKEELDDIHYNSVQTNLMNLGCWISKSIKYERSRYDQFKFKFNGLEKIEKSNGQALQDMFILSILNGKENGLYLEIGAQEPFFQNNTAILETDFGWKGISIEIKEDLCNMFSQQRKNKILCADATTVDYSKLLKEFNSGTVFDFLQLDCEPSKTTFEVLLNIPFDEYKFAIIAYEHDHYVDMTGTYRNKSRNYLKAMGYELVVANVSQNENTPFEDWWVHPDLIDKETIEKFKSIQEVTDVRKYFYS